MVGGKGPPSRLAATSDPKRCTAIASRAAPITTVGTRDNSSIGRPPSSQSSFRLRSQLFTRSGSKPPSSKAMTTDLKSSIVIAASALGPAPSTQFRTAVVLTPVARATRLAPRTEVSASTRSAVVEKEPSLLSAEVTAMRSIIKEGSDVTPIRLRVNCHPHKRGRIHTWKIARSFKGSYVAS